VVFPEQRVHGHTDEPIVIDAAVCSGVAPSEAKAGIERFPEILRQVMAEGRDELARDQAAYPGAAATIAALHEKGFVQTVLTGNLRSAAEVKLTVTHDEFEPGSKVHAAVSNGWPMILSSLKSLLETGRPSASTSAEQAHDARERAIALAESNAG